MKIIQSHAITMTRMMMAKKVNKKSRSLIY